MKKLFILQELAAIVPGKNNTVEIKHKDGSYWETKVVQIIDGWVYAGYYPGSVEK